MRKSTLMTPLVVIMGILGCSIVFSTTGQAQEKITPNQVYQVTEDILNQLDRMHDANLTKADFSSARLEIPQRLPRHVIQQAFAVRDKIQTLKRINSMEREEIPAPPVREVQPADVINVVRKILEELVSFDQAYGLSPFKPSAKLPSDKTPTDVYINLLKAERMIVQLGIPDTVPNEVFNKASLIAQELEFIRIAQGKTEPIDPPSASIGKKPADAYSLAYYALKGLHGLAKKPEFKIPGGVIVPKRLKKDVRPNDVQQLLLYCLAELSSMKVAVKAKDKLIMLPPAAGQTPSTVFDKLGLINRQIQSMQW
ncbi:MAG: hypothetical protein HWE30_11900 [Methylocystaceae bacterium]|nr:hypothetical protein [Methylocystaceae bacterium]